MTNGKMELHSKQAFAAAAQVAERRTSSGMRIEVKSDCMGRSLQLATDLETAMEIGAGPMTREVMIDRVELADQEHRPLSCALIYPG